MQSGARDDEVVRSIFDEQRREQRPDRANLRCDTTHAFDDPGQHHLEIAPAGIECVDIGNLIEPRQVCREPAGAGGQVENAESLSADERPPWHELESIEKIPLVRHGVDLLCWIRPHCRMLRIEARDSRLPAACFTVRLLRYPVIHRCLPPTSRWPARPATCEAL